MFNLENKYVILSTLTTRTEGADIPAASLRCAISMSNEVLNDFAPGLLQSFYEKHKKEQVELIKSDMLPDLKYQNMKKFSWDEEFENVCVRINEEIEQENARFIFAECTLKNFKFELKQGGSVIVEFTINCKPEPEAVGWLYGHQKQQMPITIEAGEKPQLEGFDDIEPEESSKVEALDHSADMVVTFIKDRKDDEKIEALDISNHFQFTMEKSERILELLIVRDIISKVLDKGYFYTKAEANQG